MSNNNNLYITNDKIYIYILNGSTILLIYLFFNDYNLIYKILIIKKNTICKLY